MKRKDEWRKGEMENGRKENREWRNGDIENGEKKSPRWCSNLPNLPIFSNLPNLPISESPKSPKSPNLPISLPNLLNLRISESPNLRYPNLLVLPISQSHQSLHLLPISGYPANSPQSLHSPNVKANLTACIKIPQSRGPTAPRNSSMYWS